MESIKNSPMEPKEGKLSQILDTDNNKVLWFSRCVLRTESRRGLKGGTYRESF